ncbi:MAG: UDP-glucose/GDP-mannose dehydrogenase family protein [Bacteroidia bacterium]|nr:UDP-glucose/GDP-mannose dehydrogenase family protein [Bacteroidia bacterium]MDW8236573.1 UDP-glucose/GDP-mannose dehydrogenase family protein [Bacteroidia bacterium]
MQIAVIGVGYVGLVTAAGLAESGNEVVGYDIATEKIQKLRRGESPIYEPGLDRLLARNTRENRLRFTTDLREALQDAELIFLALPTPPGAQGAADLSYLFQAAEAIADALSSTSNNHSPALSRIIITKSTVPVGTARKLQTFFQERVPHLSIHVASNPEFLREGYAVEDFLKPDRVVIGTPEPTVGEKLRTLYLPYTRQGNPIYLMDWESAELTKYAANAFLAMRISFMNELARLCEKVGANIDQVRLGMGADSRIGRRYLFAGVGYGGSCFPKDTLALAHIAHEHALSLRLVEATIAINQEQRSFFIDKIWQYYRGNVRGRTFAVWGIAFKPDTDDIRDAPSLTVLPWLLEHQAQVRVYDPAALDNLKTMHPEWRLDHANSAYEALHNADALIILTEWSEFRQIDWQRARTNLKEPVIFDGRNLYEPIEAEKAGFDYLSIGRRSVYAYSSSSSRIPS